MGLCDNLVQYIVINMSDFTRILWVLITNDDETSKSIIGL